MALASPIAIDASLVRGLVRDQFPDWAALAVEPLVPGGWDRRTFRLGDALAVRLPSAECYAAQVEKEHRWLPRLAPRLPLAIPEPVAMGAPGRGYPWPWSVTRWIAGEDAGAARFDDPCGLALGLARFLAALQAADATGGPPPGPHSFFRGGALAVYDGQARAAIAALAGRIDAPAATALWETALASAWDGPPVWVHGDVAPGNLLVRDGRLAAVIDFGCAAVGDPACDLAIAWTFFSGESRQVFRAALPLDAGTWARARGWALWKAAITLAEHATGPPADAAATARVIEDVTAEARAVGDRHAERGGGR